MEKDFEIDGQVLHYEVTGPEHAKPVILMHGWGCTHDTLRSIEKLLSPSMRVYNVDFPGFGKSPEPSEVWGVEDYTRLIERWLDNEGIVNPIILGHSFGGRVCLLMSSRRSVEKVVLVDAAGIKPHRSLKWYAKVYSFKAAKRLFPLLLGKKRGKAAIDRWRGKAGSADYNSASPAMKAILSKVVNEDLKHVMPHIKAPTLLLWGTEDTATPLKDAKTMERLIPDAGLVSFDGYGHYSFLNNPAFAPVLMHFVK